MRVRKDVYKLLQNPNDKTLEWYGRAILEMKKRATNNPTSWDYQAAIHGFNANNPFWQRPAGTQFPSPTERQRFWRQCQHQSWFFLPWHRMYLAFFEDIVAKTIVDLGGPSDWALPFWNYSDGTNANARRIPAPFTTPAAATNGLWIPGRVNSTMRTLDVRIASLNTGPFFGDGITSPLGFGGPITGFNPGGGPNGALEATPHNAIHVTIGGAMGNPATAGLDPIFWLHHCNIDRLWQVWLNQPNRSNPTQSSWSDFEFNFHDKGGNAVKMKCDNVRDTRTVLTGYTYDGVPAAVAVTESAIDFSMPLEIVAATNKKVDLDSQTTTVPLKLAVPLRKKSEFEVVAEASIPKTTMLHFENITGTGTPPTQDVYLNIPQQDGGDKESFYAGSLSLFGLEEASEPDLHHSGSGQHFALDISELMNRLRALPNWKEEELDINIEPAWEMSEGSVTIGRISLYTQ